MRKRLIWKDAAEVLTFIAVLWLILFAASVNSVSGRENAERPVVCRIFAVGGDSAKTTLEPVSEWTGVAAGQPVGALVPDMPLALLCVRLLLAPSPAPIG